MLNVEMFFERGIWEMDLFEVAFLKLLIYDKTKLTKTSGVL